MFLYILLIKTLPNLLLISLSSFILIAPVLLLPLKLALAFVSLFTFVVKIAPLVLVVLLLQPPKRLSGFFFLFTPMILVLPLI